MRYPNTTNDDTILSSPNHLVYASDLDFREATGDDLDIVTDLLAGLESYESVGLLRSVVVPARHRGQGYGTALVDAVSAHASDTGIERLYLLTTSAEAFFAARGFEEVPRDAVPDPVRTTTQFAELCPESAACLRATL